MIKGAETWGLGADGGMLLYVSVRQWLDHRFPPFTAMEQKLYPIARGH